MIINQAAHFNFGFASNMVLLLWCVFGGLLAHMLEANFLTILLIPNYEKPIDTAEDLIDRGLALIYSPGGESKKEEMMNSPYYITRTLAERTIVPKVTFYYVESLHSNFLFIGRIGLSMISGLKIKFLIKVLLLRKLACCMTLS